VDFLENFHLNFKPILQESFTTAVLPPFEIAALAAWDLGANVHNVYGALPRLTQVTACVLMYPNVQAQLL